MSGFKFPDIIGTDNPYGIESNHNSSQYTGAFYMDSSALLNAGYGHNANAGHPTVKFQAKKSNTIYGSSTLVQPKAFYTLIIVKT